MDNFFNQIQHALSFAFMQRALIAGCLIALACSALGFFLILRRLSLIGDGIAFFDKLDRDIAFHLAEVKAYKSGMVELCYEVRR